MAVRVIHQDRKTVGGVLWDENKRWVVFNIRFFPLFYPGEAYVVGKSG